MSTDVRHSDAKVFVVDDDDHVRDALSCMLEAEGFRVIAFDSAMAFLEGHDGTTEGCLLLDVDMPEMDGLELQEELNRREVFIPIIILTAHGNVPMAVKTLRSGAVDFVEKPFDEEDLLQRIHSAIARNLNVEVNPAERAVIQQRLETLSEREKEILELLVAGKWIKIIASELGTSPNTVRNQRTKILEKIQADSVPDLVRMVMICRIGQ